jgi:hypothetical protein
MTDELLNEEQEVEKILIKYKESILKQDGIDYRNFAAHDIVQAVRRVQAEQVGDLREELKQLKYFTTEKLHPSGTNTASHVLDTEAIDAILPPLVTHEQKAIDEAVKKAKEEGAIKEHDRTYSLLKTWSNRPLTDSDFMDEWEPDGWYDNPLGQSLSDKGE